MLEIYNEEYKDLLARKKVPDAKAHKVRWACLPACLLRCPRAPCCFAMSLHLLHNQ